MDTIIAQINSIHFGGKWKRKRFWITWAHNFHAKYIIPTHTILCEVTLPCRRHDTRLVVQIMVARLKENNITNSLLNSIVNRWWKCAIPFPSNGVPMCHWPLFYSWCVQLPRHLNDKYLLSRLSSTLRCCMLFCLFTSYVSFAQCCGSPLFLALYYYRCRINISGTIYLAHAMAHQNQRKHIFFAHEHERFTHLSCCSKAFFVRISLADGAQFFRMMTGGVFVWPDASAKWASSVNRYFDSAQLIFRFYFRK